MSEKNVGYKVGYWISKHPKIFASLVVAVLIYWAFGKYQAYRENVESEARVKQMIEQGIAEKNKALALMEAEREKLDQADWVKIFTHQDISSKKGGVYIEKHWFSDDRIAVRQSSTNVYEDNYYIDKNSIFTTSGDLKQASFAKDPTPSNNFYKVYTYEINCQAHTIRDKKNFWVKTVPASTKTEIEQSTGQKSVVQIPETVTVKDLSTKEGAWEEINSPIYRKYEEAVCNQNFNRKTDTKFSGD